MIPNLLYWEESVVVHDIKLENYELTSGWRAKMGQQVFVWNDPPSTYDARFLLCLIEFGAELTKS